MTRHTSRRSHHHSPLPLLIVIGATVAACGALYKHVASDPSRSPTGEVVVVERNARQSSAVASTSEEVAPMAVPTPPLGTSPTPTDTALTYLEITDSCGPHFEGTCLNARSAPSLSAPAVLKLRTGVVLRSDGIVEAEGIRWHRVIFDEWVRYANRVPAVLYVASTYGVEAKFEPPAVLSSSTPKTTKRILIDRSEQKLIAYNDDDSIFMEESISTGRDSTPTPRGTFTIFMKMPTRYMQGPLPGISTDYYDLPGVPWNLYFTEQGGALHGAYWHDKFGQQWSHGCVNLPLAEAKRLYLWADLGTTVVIRD